MKHTVIRVGKYHVQALFEVFTRSLSVNSSATTLMIYSIINFTKKIKRKNQTKLYREICRIDSRYGNYTNISSQRLVRPQRHNLVPS